MQLTPPARIKLTCALLITVAALLFSVPVKAQYLEQSGALLYALNRPNRQVFDISPDGKIAVALKNDPTAVHPAMLTTFDPILGTQFDSKVFGFGPLQVRLAKVGNNLRAVVQTSEGGPRKIFLFDVSPTGQLTEIGSTQLTTSGSDGGSNLVVSSNSAVGFVIVFTETGSDLISFSLNDAAIIKRLAVPGPPDTIALYENANTRLLAFRAGNQLKTFDVLDPSQPVETASVTLVRNDEFSGFFDDGIAFSGDGKYVFFTNQFFNFAAIDLTTKQIVGTIPGGNLRFRFVEVFETSLQRILAVACHASGTVNSSALMIVDATDPSQLVVLNNVSPAPGHFFKFTNDGSHVVAADNDGLRAINLRGFTTVWEQPAPDSALVVHQLQVYGPNDEIMGAWSVSGTLTSLFGSFPAFPPNVSLGDPTTVNENGGTTASFTVSLSSPATRRVTINYTTGGTAQAGSDFTPPASTSLIIEPGSTSATINIPILDDTLDEADETIELTISANLGIVTRAQSTAAILDNDPPPAVSIVDVNAFEGNFGTAFITFPVTLSQPSGQTVTLQYSTVAGTASGTDFIISSGTVTIVAGQIETSINVQLTPDRLSEAEEMFSIVLSNPTNATLSKTSATGTILNDDAPVLAFAASQRAVALDTLLLTGEPFGLNNPNYFGTDKRTRISLFTLNLILSPGLVITAEGVDSQQVVHQLPVEFVGIVPGFNPVVPQEPFLTQIVLRLPDGIPSAGDLQIRITARARTSNPVLISLKP